MQTRKDINKQKDEHICKFVDCIMNEKFAEANAHLSAIVNEQIKYNVATILSQENQ